MANYRWSICEPDNPQVIEKGLIRKEEIRETFEQFPWMDRLRKIANMRNEDICFSPSLEFENLDTKQGVTFSIVGTVLENEFYIFYKRSVTVKTLGLFKRQVDNHISDITGQAMEDAVRFLDAFLNNDSDYLEAKMKSR
jgi:hypothetical protein